MAGDRTVEPAAPVRPAALLYARLVVGGQEYGLPIRHVRENRRWSAPTTLPHAPPFMLGSMNLRGEVIPIVDLAALFGFGAIAPTDRHVIVVVEREAKMLGLAVEAVRRILNVSPEDVRDAPALGAARGRSYVSGLIPVDGGMVRIVDLQAVVAEMEGAP
jgi:purine-binding chemotaxis protein CheW